MPNFFEKISHRVYNLNYPAQKRTRPMEVLAVGISRSGTESLRQAIEILGISPTFHGFDSLVPPSVLQEFHHIVAKKWRDPIDPAIGSSSLRLTRDDFDHIWGNRVAITDLPAASFARELIFAYPEAKVVLNYRQDTDAWHRSFLNTLGQLPGMRYDWAWAKSWFCSELFWITRGVARGQVPHFFRGSGTVNGPWVYEEHLAMIRGLRLPPERFLEWTVEDGWEPLCQFLGKEMPQKPFPKGNNPKEFDMHVARILKAHNDRAVRNMAISAAFLILLISALVSVSW